MSQGAKWPWIIGILVAAVGGIATYTMGRVDTVDAEVHEHREMTMHEGTKVALDARDGVLADIKATADKQGVFIDEQREFNAEQRVVNRQVLRSLEKIERNGGH